MASGVVGFLRVLLSLDSAEFKSGLDKANKSANEFGKALAKVFTVTAVIAAVRQVTEYAGKIADLADQTGLSTTAIQEMGHAAKLTGTSIEAFTNAAFKLGVNLAEGTNKIHAAVTRLGLSYEAIRAMSPEDQFKTIADALGDVEDVQLRNNLAVDLFGRGAKEILPAIAQGYRDIADSASVAGEEQVKALDEAADALDSATEAAMNFAVRGLGNTIIGLKEATKNTNEFLGITRSLAEGMSGWAAIFESLGVKDPDALPKVFKETAAAAANLPAPLKAVAMSGEELARVEADLERRGRRAIELNEERIDSLNELKKAQDRFAASVQRLDTAGAFEQFRAAIPQSVIDTTTLWSDTLAETAQATSEAEEEAMEWARTNGAVLAPSIRAVSTATEESAQNITNWGEALSGLSGAFADLAQITSGSFSDAALSIGELIGSMNLAIRAGETMRQGFDKLGDGVKNSFAGIAQAGAGLASSVASVMQTTGTTSTKKNVLGGMASGAMAGAAFGPWGMAIGAVAGGIVGAFRKTNGEIAKFNAEIDKSRQKLLTQFGSMERIRKLGIAVGVDLAGAWNHQGEAGKAAFEKIAQEFEEAVAKMESDLEDFKGDLTDAIDEARELGFVFDQNGKFVEVRFEKMQEIADEFGVSLEALGPSFHAARLAADAGKIINAFDLLTKGGASIGTVLFGLKDEISKLVQDSFKFGTTIPENMRPWIQNLIDTRQLLDENGDAITDIGRINFGPPVETQFERITNKIGELIDKIGDLIDLLQDGLTPALDDATKDRTGRIHWDIDPIPNQALDLDTGTLGRMGKWFGNFGSGMAANLHNIEAVVTPQQAPAFAMDVLSGLGATQSPVTREPQRPIVVENVIENRIMLDGYEMKRWQNRSFAESIENNDGGIRSRLQDGLGVVTNG